MCVTGIERESDSERAIKKGTRQKKWSLARKKGLTRKNRLTEKEYVAHREDFLCKNKRNQ